jgi:hypothetical protein
MGLQVVNGNGTATKCRTLGYSLRVLRAKG